MSDPTPPIVPRIEPDLAQQPSENRPPAARPADLDDVAASLGGIETALRRLQSSDDEIRRAQAQLQGTVQALVTTLTSAGVLLSRPFEQSRARATAAAEDDMSARHAARIDRTPDKYVVTGPTDLDCASIIPICGARCCSLRVCLSSQDIDEGVLAWDLERPYQIRRRKDAFCVYSDPASRRCGVYDFRPGICRAYDCRKDPRIWVDFEKRILSEVVTAAAPVKDAAANEKA